MHVASGTSGGQKDHIDISCDNNYGNCRCCLAIGQHSRIFGQAELEMLMENLNIFLVADSRLPQLICSDCSTSLNDVQRFRHKVLASETELLRVISEVPIKCLDADISAGVFNFVIDQAGQSQDDPLEINKIKLNDVKSECDSDEHDYLSENIISADIEESTQNIPNIQTSNVKMEQDTSDKDPLTSDIIPRSSEGKSMNILSTSKNTPILEKEPVKSRKRKSPTENPDVNKKKQNAVFTYINIGDKSEPATDNTKIRANIILILQNSTVFPFRTKRANCFKCFYCEKTCGLFKDLKQHTATAHINGATDYTIFKWLQARNKKIIHADISDVKCRICENTVDSIDELVKHLTGVHSKVYYGDMINEAVKVPTHGVIGFKLETDNLRCHMCHTEFRFLRYLISHMIEHYGCFPCPSCNKKFVTSERLNEHCKIHVQTETKCTDCNLIFPSRRTMLDHRYIKHIKKNRKEIKCTECSKTFPVSRPILRFDHMEKEHGIKRPVYKCDLCNKTYQTIHGMNHHTRSVHVRKHEYMCDICGYVTTEKTVMSRHLDHHNGVRKFECDHCHKKFRTKGTLRLHLRGHFNDKRFACSLCDAAFIQKHCLKSHIKSRHPDSGIDVSLL